MTSARDDGQRPSDTALIRNRIKAHRKVRAGDLVPHEWNFRLHPENQKAALAGIYQEVGSPAASWPTSLPMAASS